MHGDQLAIDLEVARTLIHEQFPGWRGQSVRRVAARGTVNSLFRIGDGLVARFPLRGTSAEGTAERLRIEASAMTEFAACCDFPSPVPVAMGEPGGRYPLPWSVQTWIPGEVATPGGVADSVPFAGDLARLIRSLRAVDVRGRVFDGEGRGGDLRDNAEWMALCLRESEGIVDVAAVRVLWTRLVELPRAGADVMSHRDLIPANLLTRGGRLTGVLDSGGFGPADPSLDLVAAWHLLGDPARKVLRSELECDDLEWSRGAAWALQQAMGLVWYYAESNPDMAALGRSTVARVLADASV